MQNVVQMYQTFLSLWYIYFRASEAIEGLSWPFSCEISSCLSCVKDLIIQNFLYSGLHKVGLVSAR